MVVSYYNVLYFLFIQFYVVFSCKSYIYHVLHVVLEVHSLFDLLATFQSSELHQVHISFALMRGEQVHVTDSMLDYFSFPVKGC